MDGIVQCDEKSATNSRTLILSLSIANYCINNAMKKMALQLPIVSFGFSKIIHPFGRLGDPLHFNY